MFWKKKLQEAAVNKFFASWLRGWYDGIVRGLVPKKPKHRRLRGDWSLKNLNNMADSSEKDSFRIDMQCSSLRAETFLVFDRVLNRHLANKLPTCCQQLADSWPTIGQQLADCGPTVGRLWADCRPTVGQQSATVGRLSADSFLGELFFTFSILFASKRQTYHFKLLLHVFLLWNRVNGMCP